MAGQNRKSKNRVVDLKVEQISAALLESKGIIKDAARILECDRTALSRRIRDSASLTKKKEQAFDSFVDDVEKTYYEKMMESKDKVMMIFFLKCHGKERGWVERQELTGADGEALGQVVTPVRQMNADEWAKENLKVISG